jgi:hypothetical protein
MRTDIQLRLLRVAKKIELLRRIALTTKEPEGFGDVAKRVGLEPTLLKLRGEIFKALKQTFAGEDESKKQVFDTAVDLLRKVVDDRGNLKDPNAPRQLQQLVKGTGGQALDPAVRNALLAFAIASFRAMLMTGLMRGQPSEENKEAIEQHRQGFGDAMKVILKNISQAKKAPPVGAPSGTFSEPGKAAPEKPKDSTQNEAVKNQIGELESSMKGIMLELERILLDRAQKAFGADPFTAALKSNIKAFLAKGTVHQALNRDNDFYQDALHMSHGDQEFDLGSMLGDANKKKVYAAYRSFIMAARALGMVQYLYRNPKLVVLSPEKSKEILDKAEMILKNRREKVISSLQGIAPSAPKKKPVPQAPTEQPKPKSTGPSPAVAPPVPKGVFS